MHKEKHKISCQPFQKQEPVIKDLTEKINKAQGAEEKAKVATELQKEVDVLLNCSDYKKENLDCKNCRFIASLRKRTAALIIRTKKLV